MDVPPGWQELADPPEGTLTVLATDPDPETPLRTTAVLTREPEPLRPSDLARWSDAVRRQLPARFPRLQVLDVEQTLVRGRPARRVLSHYPTPPAGGHVLEQWLVPDDDGGLVLSCTAPALEYDDALAATFGRIAASLGAVS